MVELAVEYLLSQVEKENGGREWLDLSDLLVVVPTRNAGRRLREALAVASSDRSRGLLPPQVRVPEDFLRLEDGSEIAGFDRGPTGVDRGVADHESRRVQQFVSVSATGSGL